MQRKSHTRAAGAGACALNTAFSTREKETPGDAFLRVFWGLGYAQGRQVGLNQPSSLPPGALPPCLRLGDVTEQCQVPTLPFPTGTAHMECGRDKQ